MFKRNGSYYLLIGSGCCACIGGASIIYMYAPTPFGPFSGNVNINENQLWDPYSPYNYVANSQQTDVVKINDENYLWIGNQWVSSRYRNTDFFYFSILKFNFKDIKQFIYEENISFVV